MVAALGLDGAAAAKPRPVGETTGANETLQTFLYGPGGTPGVGGGGSEVADTGPGAAPAGGAVIPRAPAAAQAQPSEAELQDFL